MHLLAASGTSFSKHDLAGVVVIVAALAVLVWGGLKLAARAAQAGVLLLVGVLGVVLAVLLFTRSI